ncbi:MAG: DUF924 domain-containing protein [Betaproteobacteria bacterium]|jgi:uncharacterized protein (DUF924 family)|nr:MAG: DUF924 domain-containing protein [Betaproteobacteria bacterium]
MENVESILQFWFGMATDDLAVAEQRAEIWWKKRPPVDAEIRERFASVVDGAASGQHDAWLADPRGRLSMIILTDQFSRNMYRDTPRAFAFDPLALSWTKEGIASGADQALRPIERIFFYMPLEHSESIEDQERAVALITDLAAHVSSEKRKLFEGFVGFAKRHRDIVQRFGRFPHRNTILGRSSTPEELEFLKQPGSSF